MIQFGTSTNSAKPLFSELGKALSLGFDYVELSAEAPLKFPPPTVKRLKSRFPSKIKVVHAPWTLNAFSPYSSVRAGNLKHLKNVIRLAESLGSEKLVFHASGHLNHYLYDNREDAISHFIRFLESLPSTGINLCLENVSKPYFLLEDFEQIFKLKCLPRIRMTFDVGHAFLEVEDVNVIAKFLKKYAKYIDHIHIHDNNGSADDHLAIGAGSINWKTITSTLKKIKYDKTITLECFSTDKFYLEYSLKKVKELLL